MPREHRIEVRLRDLEQFFNTIDPSPFHEKDLDQDLEEFIVSWAKECPAELPIRLVVHLERRCPDDAEGVLEKAVHHYFAYKADLNRRELAQLFRRGRVSLAIGLTVLALCVTAAELVTSLSAPGGSILGESLLIGGWVAMWQPLEIYLYGWWPLRQQGRTYEKLTVMAVEVQGEGG